MARTLPIRQLTDDEIETVRSEVEGFTDELALLLWKGDLDGSEEAEINHRFDDVGHRYGGISLIFGLLWAIGGLVDSLLVFNGGADGLAEELEEVEVLCRRRRLRPALRLTEAILADAAGLEGRTFFAIDQLTNRPGFFENDLVPVLMGIWQAVVSVASNTGVGINWFIDEHEKVVEIGTDEG